jgi:hypothetical protein
LWATEKQLLAHLQVAGAAGAAHAWPGAPLQLVAGSGLWLDSAELRERVAPAAAERMQQKWRVGNIEQPGQAAPPRQQPRQRPHAPSASPGSPCCLPRRLAELPAVHEGEKGKQAEE